ncbi:TRAP transporter substrate-binding protein [Ruixingdingia sedimenti]|uniref:TRAP transporter substrate-binding protein n=1 Tax=Ruixingdingia sedimenti TaxID=3073604 RepID=A0ABU1FAB2_9RHOB|nr:TRAP transporter substrate-binding protein [Xinfangfangia sp. LG-4]MDR5653810.1 TRAP transporter substrate-binding protein [Xinfangfangia sp. LG-4]
MKMFLGIAAGAAMLLSTGIAGAESVTLRYSSWLPPTHHVNLNVMNPWFEEIEKVTEGRVKVETLPKMVGTPQSQFDVVRDGLADISFIVPGYSPGRFVLAEMAELSFVGNDARLFAPIFNKIYREDLAGANEFAEVELMTLVSNSPGQIGTTQKPVNSIADMKGLKLRSTGTYTTELLNIVGATPILKSSAEAYEMLTTGTIDGSMAQRETVKNFNMMDLLKYYNVIPGGVFSSALAIIANKDAWGRISEADRAAIDAISHEKLALALGTTYYNADADAEATMRATPTMTINVVPDAFVAELREAVKPLEAAWVERAKAKGIADPAAVLQRFRDEVAAAEAAAK